MILWALLEEFGKDVLVKDMKEVFIIIVPYYAIVV